MHCHFCWRAEQTADNNAMHAKSGLRAFFLLARLSSGLGDRGRYPNDLCSLMVNPYIPASESLSEGATGSRWDCPVCRQPVNRLRLAIPLLKCPHCRTRLCLRLPIPIKSVWLAAMLALVFFAYRWLSADPTRIIDHIWWLGLLPFRSC